MLGSVVLKNENRHQSDPGEAERKFFYVGSVSDAGLQGKITAINSSSDVDKIFSNDLTSAAYHDIKAAIANAAGPIFLDFWGVADPTHAADAVDKATSNFEYEAVCYCDPVSTSAELEAIHAQIETLKASKGQFLFAITKTTDITTEQSWSDYVTVCSNLVSSVAAETIIVVPSIFGNELGVLAGRLCNRTVTIADSPIRVETGPLVGLGVNDSARFPTDEVTGQRIDSEGEPIDNPTLKQLDELRLSVPQHYIGMHGWYWADGLTLDEDTGDYKVIENLRVVLKACRRVLKVATPMIGNRQLNSTVQGTNSARSRLLQPLLKMSRASVINGVTFVGEIKRPTEEAISIVWKTQKTVQILMSIRPYLSQKSIEIGIGLDLSTQREG